MSSPESPPRLGLFHRAFDRLYPAIRFTYERLLGHAWFSQITPSLWLGGAPTYGRDFRELSRLGISAVVDVRAERVADPAFFEENGIAHRQYHVPDVTVPDEGVLTDAVDWMAARIHEGRVVLIHCAKGRGRSATVLAAYLMDEEGMTFEQVDELLTRKRPLVKLQDRHREVLESWIAKRRAETPRRSRGRSRPGGIMTTQAPSGPVAGGRARQLGRLGTSCVLALAVVGGCGGSAEPASSPGATEAIPTPTSLGPGAVDHANGHGRAVRSEQDGRRCRDPGRGGRHRSLRLHR